MANQNCFHFLFNLNAQQSFVGSTPECLYKRTSNEVQIDALAGTTKRGCDDNEDQILANWLQKDPKNLHENQLVVDDIMTSIAPYIDKAYVDEKPHVLVLRKLQHLKREIKVNLVSEPKALQLLNILHPTAAVSGFPRDKSYQFIINNEVFSRDWYAGALGYISATRENFCVSLRCALIQDNVIQLYSGAGIVHGSNAKLEWQELDQKISTLLSLFTDSKNNLSKQI